MMKRFGFFAVLMLLTLRVMGQPAPLTRAQVGSTVGIVTPQMYGAKGDGTTDDTVALQAWLNAASINNVIACLTPAAASPGYYKITDTLKVTNVQGIKIVGNGGGKFVSGPSLTRSRIRQFTSGANGILFLSANGSTNAPAGSQADGISLDSFYIDSNDATFTAGSIGIGFMGDGTAADCSYINQVGVAHFDTGFYVQTLADATFHACSPGYNAYGVKIAYAYGIPATTQVVVNNILFESCQLSYNYSNQLFMANGNVSLFNCDVTATDTAALSAVLIQDHGALYADNGRFEEYCPWPAIFLNGTNHSVAATIRNCGFSNPNTAAKTYSILGTNSTVNLMGNNALGAVSTDTYAVKMVDTDGTVSPAIRSLEPLSISYIAASAAFAPYYIGGSWMRNIYATGTTPIEGGLDLVPHSGAINWNGVSQGGFDNNFSMLTRARIVMMDGAGTVIMNGPFTIDLLQYFKDTASRIPGVNLWASNSVQIFSNTAALFPLAPAVAGAAVLNNSNGVVELVTSGLTASWEDTNKLAIIKFPYLTANTNNANTTFAGGLSSRVINAHKYAFTCILYFTESVSGDGAKIDFNGGTATSTFFQAHVKADSTLGTPDLTSISGTTTAASVAAADMWIVHGVFEPSSSGTFVLRFAANSHSTGTLTLGKGSHMLLTDVSP